MLAGHVLTGGVTHIEHGAVKQSDIAQGAIAKGTGIELDDGGWVLRIRRIICSGQRSARDLETLDRRAVPNYDLQRRYPALDFAIPNMRVRRAAAPRKVDARGPVRNMDIRDNGVVSATHNSEARTAFRPPLVYRLLRKLTRAKRGTLRVRNVDRGGPVLPIVMDRALLQTARWSLGIKCDRAICEGAPNCAAVLRLSVDTSIANICRVVPAERQPLEICAARGLSSGRAFEERGAATVLNFEMKKLRSAGAAATRGNHVALIWDVEGPFG